MLFAIIVLSVIARARADVRALWDMQAIQSDPLDVKVLEETRDNDAAPPLRKLHLTYLSQKWKGQDVRIEAFVAIPVKPKGKVPAVLSLHGHGGAGSAGDALGKAHQAVEGNITGVTRSLGTAFNSTFIALLISIVLMFLLHRLQLQQERLVRDTETYVDSHLIQHPQGTAVYPT